MSLSTTTVTVFAVIWRILTATTTRTFFQPDEFYQSLEVAHDAVFGYGHLTWEWKAWPPIRSIAFPSLYMPVFWLLKKTNLHNTAALIIAPKVMQGLFAAVTDIATYHLSSNLIGKRYASTAFFLSCTSFFHFLALGRTLSNSVETSLTATALCFWPWNGKADVLQTAITLSLAALTCMIRPTNIILWVFMLAATVRWIFRQPSYVPLFLNMVMIVGVIFLSMQFVMDWIYFGRPTLTALNFVTVNLSNVSLFYGQSPWHYYLTQGLPLVSGTCLPFFIQGTYRTLAGKMHVSRRTSVLIGLIWWTIGIYSFAGHKEWRFLHPLSSLIHIVAAKTLVDVYPASQLLELKKKDESPAVVVPVLPVKRSIVLFLLSGIVPGIYITYFHSSSQIAVMAYLRSLDTSELRSVGFLMPCHSTPWQAYLHKPHLAEDGRLWSIGCEPPLYGQNLSEYQDQSDIFYRSPLHYIRQTFPIAVDPSFPPSPKPSTRPGSRVAENHWDHRWPSHLVFFGALLSDTDEGRAIQTTLTKLGYFEMWAGKASLEEDRRRRGGVRVWRWQPMGT